MRKNPPKALGKADLTHVSELLLVAGDVLVQTAGPASDIDFRAVPQPAEVVSIINEMMH